MLPRHIFMDPSTEAIALHILSNWQKNGGIGILRGIWGQESYVFVLRTDPSVLQAMGCRTSSLLKVIRNGEQ